MVRNDVAPEVQSPNYVLGSGGLPDGSSPVRNQAVRSSVDWLLSGAIETDEKMATDLEGPGYHINWSNLLVLESKADMQKRRQASPDGGDALALTFAQEVAPAEVEERDEDEYGYGGSFNGPVAWMR